MMPYSAQNMLAVPNTTRLLKRRLTAVLIALAMCWLIWVGYIYLWIAPVDRFVPLTIDRDLFEVSKVQLNGQDLTSQPLELVAGTRGNVLTMTFRSNGRLFVGTDPKESNYGGFIVRAFANRLQAADIAREAHEAKEIDPVCVLHFGPTSGRGWGEDITTAFASVKTSADRREATLHFLFDTPPHSHQYQLNVILWKPKAPVAHSTGGIDLAGAIVWSHPLELVSEVINDVR